MSCGSYCENKSEDITYDLHNFSNLSNQSVSPHTLFNGQPMLGGSNIRKEVFKHVIKVITEDNYLQ